MADRLDLVFKKIVGREYTSTSKKWHEEFAGTPFTIGGDNVWIDYIPSIPPSSGTASIKIFDTLTLVKDISVSDNKSWLAEYPTHTRIGSFVPPRYGQGYNVRVYDSTDTEIVSSDASNWFFDYDFGILTFDNPPTDYGWSTPFKIKAYRYIGRTANDITTGSGGLAASEVENDSNIPGLSVKDALDYLSTGSGIAQKFKFNQALTLVSGTQIYALPENPVYGTVEIYLNGLLQEPGEDYTISGDVISFILPIEVGDTLLASYISQ